MPFTLAVYLAKSYFKSFLLMLCLICGILLFFDLFETFRKSFSKEVPGYIITQLVLLKIPYYIEKTLSFAVLLGSIYALTSLSLKREIVVIRSSGVSLIQLLKPFAYTTIVIAILAITLVSPLTAVLMQKSEKLEAKYFRNSNKLLSYSEETGIWLREKDENRGINNIINAKYIGDDLKLFEVAFFILDKQDKFYQRIDAKSAIIFNDNFVFHDITNVYPIENKDKFNFMPTKISLKKLLNSFDTPETVSFWSLPKFIDRIASIGLSTTEYKLYFYKLIFLPFFLLAVILLGPIIALGNLRNSKVGVKVITGIIAGFLLYFISDVIYALGLSGRISLAFAGIAPALITAILGVWTVLHVENT